MMDRFKIVLILPFVVALYGCRSPRVADSTSPDATLALHGVEATGIISRANSGDYALAELRQLEFGGDTYEKKDLHLPTPKSIETKQAVLVKIDPKPMAGDESYYIHTAKADGIAAQGIVKKETAVFNSYQGAALGFGFEAKVSNEEWVTAGGSGYATIISVDNDTVFIVNMKPSGSTMPVNCLRNTDSIPLPSCHYTISDDIGSSCSFSTPKNISQLSSTGAEGEVREVLIKLREMAMAYDDSLSICSP